jgi:hypothetical protein
MGSESRALFVIVIDIVHHHNYGEEHKQNHDDGQSFLQLWEVNKMASTIVRSMIAYGA